ncbi:ATP-dependent protease ATPase subunit ClpY [Planctomycetes bacterium Pan216]|uniref:ATP-dependent protease ATPase subunit HslU n=1 Tax=Kolteria novifilia TaxID=2527975 RepID=A0A518B5N1_9BACT|nr:ATP-dependent protease ATPase subunit ClpY [Planctomycetes bacterium Pan216]
MQELTPREIVASLDRYIVGQAEAKRAVAIAVRNRWRRQRLSEEMRKEVTPKNIIMIGPTGVGKTEIARRLASLCDAPFCKVEATKYTEVGYHGRDVESVIRDLVEAAWRLVREQERVRVEEEANQRANDRLLDLLLPNTADEFDSVGQEESDLEVTLADESDPETFDAYSKVRQARSEERRQLAEKHLRTRDRLRAKLEAGDLEDRRVTLKVDQKQVPVQIFSAMGMEQMDVDLQHMFDRIMPREGKSRELSVKEARKVLVEQEIENLIDREAVGEKAIALAEESGVVFIDEIDKVCGPSSSSGNPDVSRQGVQRDLLPIVEGTTVQTRYGNVHTEHILFIAAGAFHVSKPSDLMPELQGRFPIRVELKDLGQDDFARILREPKNSITRQYRELLATEGIDVEIQENAIDALAEIAHQVNKQTQNIGARRLHTIMERLLEDLSFDAPEMKEEKVVVDADYVREKLDAISQDEDLSKFIL